MRNDTTCIDRAALIRLLSDEYECGIVSLAFYPHGEEAWNFRAVGAEGAHYLVRVQESTAAGDLGLALRVAAHLHDRCGLTCIVAARPNRRGTYTAYLGHHTIALFPFVEGVSVWGSSPAPAVWPAIGEALAMLHAAGPCITCPRETFAPPFVTTVSRALIAARNTRPQSDLQDRVLRLLRADTPAVSQTLTRLQRLGRDLRRRDLDGVITHGDPNTANVLVTPEGDLRLIDWGEVAWGPPERDLSAYTEYHFAEVLAAYCRLRPDVRLHSEVFAYYAWRWVLQEIAAYAGQILFTPQGDEADRHAWEELQPYLPIREEAVKAQMAVVEAV